MFALDRTGVASDRGPTRPQVGPFAVGHVVAGAFEILAVLGVGGMGVVYDARDVVLARRVALKVPLAPMFAEALRREAQALAAIAAPSFVQVYHCARDGEIDFMVMERLFGDTLEVRLAELRAKDVRMPLDEVLRVLVALADALSAAHRVGIAQRDVKPANVMLAGERIVLFDLGLFVPEVLVSPDNDVSGSAEYMAPEVLMREVAKGEGPLVDLYALGIVAFELLTNTTPFASDSVALTLARQVSTPAPDVTTLRGDVPFDLAVLIADLLSKEPSGRPASAEAVLWQLEAIRERAQRRAGSMRVVAIDDEIDVGLALKRSLEQAFPGMLVEATTDPRSVLGTSRNTDVVLVDLAMPEQNGVEVCMQILALPAGRRPVVVGMSAQASEIDIAVLRSLGVRHFVHKDADFVASMSGVLGHIRRTSTAPPHHDA